MARSIKAALRALQPPHPPSPPSASTPAAFMSSQGESSQRSNLIDLSYSQLRQLLGGNGETTSPEVIKEHLNARKDTLKNVTSIFGKPSDASRKKIQSGSVQLPDGVTVMVEEADKDFVWAISSRFGMDEVQAFILFRSFLYNQGLPSTVKSQSSAAMIEELVTVIAPYYYSERLAVIQTLAPLFRVHEDETEFLCEAATQFLPEIAPDPVQFAIDLVNEYVAKTKEPLPNDIGDQPKAMLQRVKQNLKEQLALLELLFWVMWGYTPCAAPIVLKVFEAAYAINLGTAQLNQSLMLDDESQQLQQDCAAYWILIMVEVLELETVGNDEALELSETPTGKTLYIASPDTLVQLHDIITSNVNSQFACTYLSWAYVLSRIIAKASTLETVPPSYQQFLDIINPPLTRSYTKDPELIHLQMAKACISPEAGLFTLLHDLLTKSPVFVVSVAWKTGSTVADPNAIAYRSIVKGVIIALVELTPVELIPDFEGLVDVWVALFGRSEPLAVAAICAQFWQTDWKINNARRAIFDVARNRFPVQIKPLLRLLRAMTGSGFLDTDPLSTSDHGQETEELSPERQMCNRFVYYYFASLPTFTQVIPLSACTGAHALYEKLPERYANGSTAFTYTNVRPIRLPGGSQLPVRSSGTVVSADSGDYIVVSWKHQHSGWKILLEILTDYVNRRHLHYQSSGGQYQDISFSRRGGNAQPMTLQMRDAGMDINDENDEVIVTDVLDLVRSVIQANPQQAETLMISLEDGEPVVSHQMTEAQPPDLVQLTTMILEEALSRSNGRARSPMRIQLITSAISVLSALLTNRVYSKRVWLYIRSTTALFGTETQSGFASLALSLERATGHYTMTLALLYLVQQLFSDASLSILPDDAKLQQVKEDVLLRAVRFVHTEIWIEHLGWKYAQLGDRFEIGRRISSLYSSILQKFPLTIENRPYALLSQVVGDVLLFKATTSTITPLVNSISSGGQIVRMLHASRRFGDVRRLLLLLDWLLRLSRQILNLKIKSPMSSKPSLLEQSLCARVIGNGNEGANQHHTKQEAIDVLAKYVRDRDIGPDVPLRSIRLLTALARSMSLIGPSPPTIIGHLSDPEAVVSAFVRIIQHPYDDSDLRIAVWNFVSLVVGTEPALGGLFVAGRFRVPMDVRMEMDRKGKRVEGKGKEDDKAVVVSGKQKGQLNALDVAHEFLSHWRNIWDVNPQVLSVILRFLTVVWKHALEHKLSIQPLQTDSKFWAIISEIVQEEIGPVPEYETTECLVMDKVQHSNHHDSVVVHAYKTLAKSYAVQLTSLDIGFHLEAAKVHAVPKRPESYLSLQKLFRTEEELSDLLSEAAPSPYSPTIYDNVAKFVKDRFAGLSLDQLELQDPLPARFYGDQFSFSLPVLQDRLQAYKAAPGWDPMDDSADAVIRGVLSVNLNLSLTHAQAALAEAWDTLLHQATSYLRSEPNIRPTLVNIASSISGGIALEKRGGEMMASIHGTRLSLLLAILEVAWFSTSEKDTSTTAFLELVKNLRDITVNEAQSPINSFIRNLPNPFYRPLLQLIFFCAKESRVLANRPKALNSDQRLTIGQTIESALNLVLEALGIVFVSALNRQDVELDRDMELLVAVFQQCSRPDITPSSTYWLSRCQETDVMRASLQLFSRTDLSGLSNIPLLLSRKHPLYAPHILLFHMAVVSNPIAAERFAGEGLLASYSNNSISSAISSGRVDVVMPELPGERSPVHVQYCSMLSIVATVISALGRHNHYFDAEACGFVQLYGEQIVRALRWTVGDTITMPLVEEMEQVVYLFYAIAASVPNSARGGKGGGVDEAVKKVLNAFTTHGLLLLQQINYAVTHPNHLASLFEPVTPVERSVHEKTGGAGNGGGDPLKRPLVAHLVHRLFRLSSNIVDTLVCVSKADTVLCASQEDWPVQEALIVPHSKVVLGEPASLGTLLELGNCSLDIIRDFVNRPADQSLTRPSPPSPSSNSLSTPLDVRQALVTARRNLEGILVYAVTQLAMWLSKPEFDNAPQQQDDAMDDQQDGGTSRASEGSGTGGSSTAASSSGGLKDRSSGTSGGSSSGGGTSRSATTSSMAERLRRGMTGDMASDLQALLNKAKPLIAKCDQVVGGKGGVDVMGVLSVFLQERVVGSS